MQIKQDEWRKQWEMFRDEESFLFQEWIYPNTIEDFRDKEVLECGCGGGQHTALVSRNAKSITAVDLNTTEVAKKDWNLPNAEFIEADIAEMNLDKKFDIVFSIGVIHHTDNPSKTVENLKRHLKPGGKLIIWVYSEEGNFLVKYGVEPIRKLILKHLNKFHLTTLSQIITALVYLPVYTLYLLPLKLLPYYEYFGNWRKLTFKRNCLNVFDKLNAPQVIFITKKVIYDWFNPQEFKDIHISQYKGVSWRASGVYK